MKRAERTNITQFRIADFIDSFCTEIGENPTRRYCQFIAKILKDVNDLLLDEVILNKYTLKIGECMQISLRRIPRNFEKLAVNWGESNKAKQKILDRGGKLATKLGVDSVGNPIFDDGEKWMVFFIDEYYLTLKRNYVYRHISSTDSIMTNPLASFWHFKTNQDANRRINRYIDLEKISVNQFPLHVRNKNNFI